MATFTNQISRVRLQSRRIEYRLAPPTYSLHGGDQPFSVLESGHSETHIQALGYCGILYSEEERSPQRGKPILI
jgi:hypothetical protein